MSSLLGRCQPLKETSQQFDRAILSLKGNLRQYLQRRTVEKSQGASRKALFQLGEFCAGSLEDGEIRVRCFPEIEETLVGVTRGILVA